MAGYYTRAESDEPSGDDPELERYKRWFRDDMRKTGKWRKEAREDFQFRDGHQWSAEDKQILEEQGRPIIVFNRTGVLVDAVVGSEVGNRREVRYIPRELADAKPNELLTSAAEWFRDQCDAEDEESEAFKDTVTAGMGWTETRLDRTNNPDGDPKIERVDPFEMVWDCAAQKANLVDSKRRWRVRKMDLADARKLLDVPNASWEELNAAWADEDTYDGDPIRTDPDHMYNQEAKGGKDAISKKVTVVILQHKEESTYYKTLLLTPPAMEPQIVDLDEAKFKIAEKQGAVLDSAKMKREQVMQCVLGSKVLKKPVPTQTGDFTWACITGLKDEDKGVFYGIIRRAKDPQRWANKWLSQMLHILNSQSKGGIMAERDAFEDQRDAEESWARTDRITWLERGALSGASPKIQPKPMAQFPAGFAQLMQIADEHIVKATGINMELLGMREVNQPGVLEYQRKQSGMGILATFFDSLRRYRKIQGRGMLKLIQEHLADGRLVKIVGDDRAQYVPLTKAAVANVEYDIIIDDAPTSPNEKEKTFQLLMQFLPMFKDSIGPEQAMLIAEYSPLPASLVEKLKQSVQAQQGQPDPAQQAEQMKMAAGQQKMQMDMQVKKLEADLKMEEMKLRLAEMQHEREMAVIEQGTERIKVQQAYAAASQPQVIRQPAASRSVN